VSGPTTGAGAGGRRRGRGARRLAAARALVLACVLGGALAGAAPLATAAAQSSRGIDIQLAAPTVRLAEGPLVRVAGVLDRRELRDLLEHNFPLRLRFRTELWSAGRWFDDVRGTSEWELVIRRDPLDHSYQVVRLVGEQATLIGEFGRRQDAVEAAERPYRVPLLPRQGARQYYTAMVEIEAMSLSDLDEVERWLRGELRPAVRGQRNPGTALGRGLRTLAVRLLGSESAEYRGRTTTFRP
jgi:hypothetical protein